MKPGYEIEDVGGRAWQGFHPGNPHKIPLPVCKPEQIFSTIILQFVADKTSVTRQNIKVRQGKNIGNYFEDQNRCLGIYVGYSRDKNLKRNYDENLDKVKHILTSWKDRDLSLFDKVQIIKTFVVSQFVTCFSIGYSAWDN